MKLLSVLDEPIADIVVGGHHGLGVNLGEGGYLGRGGPHIEAVLRVAGVEDLNEAQEFVGFFEFDNYIGWLLLLRTP